MKPVTEEIEHQAGNDKPVMEKLRPLRRALPFLKPYKPQLLLALFCLLAASVAALGMPVAIRYVIDHGFTGEDPASINSYFLYLLGLGALFAVFAGLRHYMVMWIGERFVADLRRSVYEHVIVLSPRFFEETRPGEVLSRLTTDTTLVQSVFGAGISIALRSLIMLAGALIMLFVTSPRLTAMIFLLIPLVVLPVLFYGRKVRRLSRENQDRVADTSGIAGESLNAIQTVQAFTLETFLGRRYAEAVEDAFNSARRRLLVSSLLSSTIVLTAFSAIIIVLWIGARGVISGAVSPGVLGQFLLYAVFVAGSITALGEVWGSVQRAAGAMERLMELLGARPEIRSQEKPVPLPAGEAGISLEDVTFCYPTRPDQPALKEFSLHVNPGETVALVGPSGAGKSTVFQLLLRFYDPQSGLVRFNGVDIRDADIAELRGRIGMVPQQTILFADSALENIRYGRPGARDEEVHAAARAAMADQFIRRMPDGYHTFLGERGLRLSGGQQQRIAIARAVLRDPSLLLLDEATSALDAESEQLVQEALDRLIQDRTTIVIAHRLATVRRADRIIVMTEGGIIETGRHEDLIGENGLYARLAELQFDNGDGAKARMPAYDIS
ncbi:MAG: ABC transporter transmembrane domain-containing protein [Gammaproteobacteria bacterium]